MNTLISENAGDHPNQGEFRRDEYAAHQKASAEIGQRLFDTFTNLSLPPGEVVSAYKGVKESILNNRNLGEKAWLSALRTAKAYLGAALSLEADGGTAKLAQARKKAVKLHAYYECGLASINYFASSSDSDWNRVTRCCVYDYMIFYGWTSVDEESITPEVEAIILEARDELGIPRDYGKSGYDWTENENVFTSVFDDALFDNDQEWRETFENVTEVAGIPNVHTGTNVLTYVGGYRDMPISPIEVRDIVRASLQEILELEYRARIGYVGNPGKIEWRHERIKALVEAGLISGNRVEEIRNELWRDFSPIETCGPAIDDSSKFHDEKDFEVPFWHHAKQ